MLTVKEIHLLIEQGLNSLGMFTEMANLHTQVDFAVNHVVEKDIRDILDTPKKQRSMLQNSIIEFLTKRETYILQRGNRFYEAPLPSDFGEISSSYTVLGLCNCKTDDCIMSVDICIQCTEEKDTKKVNPRQYYITKTDVKYNGIWYKPDKVFKTIEGVTDVYGTVLRLSTKEKVNFDTTIDSLDSFGLSAIVKNSFRPVLAWDLNKFYIYYKPFKKGSEVPLELGVNYISTYTDNLHISWCDNRTLGFPAPIQRYYIDLAIAYLAVINKQEQQNVVNLKSETI